MYLYNVPTSMYVIPKRDSYLQYLRLRNLYNLIQFYIDLIIRMNANNCMRYTYNMPLEFSYNNTNYPLQLYA